MERRTEPEKIDDTVNIGGKTEHLRRWTPEEITQYINYRMADIDRAVIDIGVATSILREMQPDEYDPEDYSNMGEHPPITGEFTD